MWALKINSYYLALKQVSQFSKCSLLSCWLSLTVHLWFASLCSLSPGLTPLWSPRNINPCSEGNSLSRWWPYPFLNNKENTFQTYYSRNTWICADNLPMSNQADKYSTKEAKWHAQQHQCAATTATTAARVMSCFWVIAVMNIVQLILTGPILQSWLQQWTLAVDVAALLIAVVMCLLLLYFRLLMLVVI